MVQHIQKLIDACNQHDVLKISQFFSNDFKGMDITYAKKHRGKEDLSQNLQEYFSAFPDVHFTTDKLVIDGNQITIFWTATATHTGIILKIPPSFKKFSVQGVWFLEMQNSYISGGTGIWDIYGFLRSIRLMPDLPHEKPGN